MGILDAPAIPLVQKGAPSGVAALDGTGKVPDAQLPASLTRDSELAAAINAILDGAPAALDTLNELAAAISDDASFAATVTTALNARVRLPALDGINLDALVRDSTSAEGVRWGTSNELVARALGWRIVTDARFAGGAHGDGIADDTAAVVAAMAANTVVWFPPGTYKHTGITTPTNCVLQGTGDGSVLKGGTVNLKTRTAVHRLRFISNAPGEGNAVQVHNLTQQVDVEISDCSFDGWAYGVYLDRTPTGSQPDGVKILRNVFTNCYGGSIFVIASTNLLIEGNRLYQPNSGRGILIYGGQNIWVVRNLVDGGVVGIGYLWNGSTSTGVLAMPERVFVTGNTVKNFLEEGISLDSHGNSAANVSTVDCDTIAAVAGQTIRLGHAGWATAGAKWSGYRIAFLDGQLRGRCYRTTSTLNGTFGLNAPAAEVALAAPGDRVTVLAAFLDCAIVDNTVDGASGGTSIMFWGGVYNSLISRNRVGHKDIVLQSLNGLVAATGSVTGSVGRAPIGHCLVSDNIVTDANISLGYTNYGGGADYASYGTPVTDNVVPNGTVKLDRHQDLASGNSVGLPITRTNVTTDGRPVEIAGVLPTSGGAMTGDIAMGGHKVTGLADPAAAQDAATRAYVLAQINALINGAPGTLDTLNEIATQLAADESAAAALTTAVAGKQPLDADLTAIAALDSATAGAIASDGAGWIKKSYAQLKTALGLGNVDDTADTAKPVSTAQQAALDLKASLATIVAAINASTETTRIAKTKLAADVADRGPRPKVGEWLLAAATTVGTYASPNGEARLHPMWLPPGTYDAVAFSVATAGAAGSVCRVIAYSDNNGLPDALILDSGQVDTTAAGTKTVTSASWVLPAATAYTTAGEVVWVAVVNQGAPATTATIRHINNESTQLVQSALDFTFTAVSRQMTAVTGAPPATPTAMTTANGPHRVAFRRSA